MFILLEYNEFYEENLLECKNNFLEPITIFNIFFKDKKTIREDIKKIKEKKESINPKYSALIINIEKVENFYSTLINELSYDFDLIIGYGGLNKINRFFLENTSIDFLMNPQNSDFKVKIDFIHHFNSGLNHVLVNFAKEKNISFIFSLNFLSGKPFNIAKEFGRINQNLLFTRKKDISSHINFIIKEKFDIKTEYEIKNILKFFTISNKQISQSINILEEKIIKNRKKQSENFIKEGIEFV